MRRNLLLLTLLCAILASLFACADSAEVPNETTAASPISTTTEPPSPPEDDLTEQKTVFSSELYCGGDFAVWTTPRDSALIRVDLQTGEETVLCDRAVGREFFVVGERVIFRELESGQICAVNTDGTDYISYYQMPLSKGVVKNGTLYFVETDDSFAGEAVLYQYKPLAGVWSTGILPGCYLSPVYDRAVFGEDALYYIAVDEHGERIVRQSLESGERRTIYQPADSGTGRLTELVFAGGTLYFHDGAADCFYRYSEAADTVSAIEVPGERICAVMANGLVTKTKAVDGSSLVFSNPDGQFAEFRGGVVEATGLSRALVRRTTDDGKDLLALVKYPEDEVQSELVGELLRVITDGAGHAVVFMYGESVCYYIDLNRGTTKEFASETKYLNRIGLERYVALESVEHTVLSGHDLPEAEPLLIANAFAKAVVSGDRLSLAVLLFDYGVLEAFPAFYLKDWELVPASSTAPDEQYVCRISYTAHTEGDLTILDYMPEIIRDGRLTLTSDGACWMITPSAARYTRSR